MAVMKMLAGTSNLVMVINNYRPGPYIMDIFCVRANCCGMGSGHFMWICLYKHQWRQKPLEPAEAVAGGGNTSGRRGTAKHWHSSLMPLCRTDWRARPRNTNALAAALFSLPLCWDSVSCQIKNMFTSPWVPTQSPGLNHRFSYAKNDIHMSDSLGVEMIPHTFYTEFAFRQKRISRGIQRMTSLSVQVASGRFVVQTYQKTD